MSAAGAVPPPPPPLLPGELARKGLPVWVWILIAVAIVPVAGFVLLLFTVPNFSRMSRKANEVSAIISVRTIVTAETMYESNYPANGFACSLAALGGNPTSGAPSPEGAQLIQPDLATGTKAGYRFGIASCTKMNEAGSERIVGFKVTAVPQTPEKTGERGFCSDETGVVKFDPAGGTNCTENLPQ